MWKSLSILALILVCGCTQTPPDTTSATASGFTPIFNGHDFTNWRGRKPELDPALEAKFSPQERETNQTEWNLDRDKHWTIDPATGELSSDGKGVYLATTQDYGDFELVLDWKLANPHADSGIYLHGYPQVQIWDPDFEVEIPKGSLKGSGGLYNNTPGTPGQLPLVRADKPIGQWNTYRIKMQGNHVTVWLNNQLIVDNAVLENSLAKAQPLAPRGPIVLQAHAGIVKFRNISIRE